MTIQDIKSWLRQDTTVNGIGLFLGVAAGAVAQALTHNTDWSVAAGTMTAGAVHLVAPGNAPAAASVQKLAADLVTAAVNKKLAAAVPELMGDGFAVMQALQAPAPTPAAPAAAAAPAGAPA